MNQDTLIKKLWEVIEVIRCAPAKDHNDRDRLDGLYAALTDVVTQLQSGEAVLLLPPVAQYVSLACDMRANYIETDNVALAAGDIRARSGGMDVWKQFRINALDANQQRVVAALRSVAARITSTRAAGDDET